MFITVILVHVLIFIVVECVYCLLLTVLVYLSLKFVLDASVLQSTLSSGPRIRTAKSAERLPPASMQDTLAPTPSLLSATPPPSHMLLQPLVNSWVETRYSLARCLHVWSTELTDDAIVSLVNIELCNIISVVLICIFLVNINHSLVAYQQDTNYR